MTILLLGSLPALATPNTPAPDTPTPDTPTPDTLMIGYQYAIYLMPTCGATPVDTAKQVAKTHLPKFSFHSGDKRKSAEPQLNVQLENDVQQNYAPPSLQMLGYFGRGLTEAQIKTLQKSKTAILLNFSYPQQQRFTGMKKALIFTEQLAKKCDGLIWDEQTREVFTASAWNEKRLTGWHDDLPEASNHTVIHAYRNNKFIRAISLGMSKFNQPDIVINDYPSSGNRQMGNLINIVAQSLIEGNPVGSNGKFDLDITKIKHNTVKTNFLDSQLEGAKTRVSLQLSLTIPQEGDPQNVLVEVNFSQWPGKGLQEKQNALLETLFGVEDKITYIKHNEKLEKASQAAKQKLPALKKAFNDGFEPGGYLLLKAPFTTADDGREWMWVEVAQWQDNNIKGVLQSQPYNVPQLKSGAEVTVNQGDIFDYIRYFADGRKEGNETGKLIQQYQQQ